MQEPDANASLRIRRLQGEADAGACAYIMSTSEPWVTLGRTFDICLARVTDPERETWVACDGHDVLGFIVLSMQGPFIGYVQTVAIRADQRGRGLGSRLLGFAEERILRETPNVFLCVSSFNPLAFALYERLGYERIGDLRDYVVSGHAEILMRKSTGPLVASRPAPAPAANGELLVRRYYDELWNAWRDDLVDELLAPDFDFRGSLGESVRGRDGFRRYRDRVRSAFPDFENVLVDVVAGGQRVAARLEYRGTHHGPLFDCAPTGRRIAYSGAAFFRVATGRLAAGWVLGDTEALRRQLASGPAAGG